ncbi:MAG: hypothetical protein HC845_01955 [Akkermansiaceae bacterium]|nr:hypothetical protein [Akkermansiaceae bacterium]
MDFPAEIADIATSLQRESAFVIHRHEVLPRVIHHFSRRYRQIGNDFGEVISSLQKNCALTGNQVSLTTTSGRKTGTIEGISPEGELLLRTAAGLEAIIQADEVRLLR